jgi:hypothetical protein
LVNFDRNFTLLANFNSLFANFQVILNFSVEHLLTASLLAVMLSELTILLMFDSFCICVSDEASAFLHELWASFHWAIESQVHEHVVDELVDLDVLGVWALQWAVRLLFLPFLNASLAE